MKIIWSNSGGELDSIVATDGGIAELIAMIEAGGELRVGDIITVVEDGAALGPLVERVHVADPTTAVERYKGFVIRTGLMPGLFRWEHGTVERSLVETVRADIDLWFAKVDTAGASRG